MNKTLTLTAITLVAVAMGLSSFAPAAMAIAPEPRVAQSVCHFDEDPDDNPETEDAAWLVVTPNSHGATNGHVKHGDTLVNNETEAGFCVSNQDGSVTEPEE
jgi:hypothetical protein